MVYFAGLDVSVKETSVCIVDEGASVRFMNCKGDEDVDAKRSRPSIGKPDECHAGKERVLLKGADQRIRSVHAARTAAFRGRIHGCPRTIRGNVRFFSLAPRAPSIHDPSRTWLAVRTARFGPLRN